MVHSCPRCELRFRMEAEVKEHLAADHGVPVEGFERYRYEAPRRQEPLYAPSVTAAGRRCLVVANQTLGGPDLRQRVEGLAAGSGGSTGSSRAPVSFHVLVPATSPGDLVDRGRTFASVSAGQPSGSEDVTGAAQARWRLDRALATFRELGVEVTGEVGDADPLAAVADVLGRERIDEVLISTLPHGRSRWLGMDLPQRIQQRFRLPVHTIVSTG